LGFQFQQIEQWDRAIVAYEQAVHLAPKWVKIHLMLGEAYESAGQVENSLSSYRRGILFYKELTADARLPLVSIYGKLCKRTAETLLSNPRRQSSEVGEALQLLCESAEANPNDANCWYRLGKLLIELGRLDDALEYLQ